MRSAVTTTVAIKRIRSKGGDPGSKNDPLRELANEVMVLTQPKLRANENIIDLHCLVWEDRGSDVALWPSLVMEFCPITLAELQAQIPTPLGKTIKALLIQGIGNGMDALHEEDFIHGDLKSENILIQFEGEAVMVPKISDFGSAILVWESENLVPVGGTDPWRAPEVSFKDQCKVFVCLIATAQLT